jgi:hypothetical protein
VDPVIPDWFQMMPLVVVVAVVADVDEREKPCFQARWDLGLKSLSHQIPSSCLASSASVSEEAAIAVTRRILELCPEEKGFALAHSQCTARLAVAEVAYEAGGTCFVVGAVGGAAAVELLATWD